MIQQIGRLHTELELQRFGDAVEDDLHQLLGILLRHFCFLRDSLDKIRFRHFNSPLV